MNMHEDITEHIAHDKGYNQGVQDGMRNAWTLVGEIAKYYKQELELPDQDDGFRKRYNKRLGRYEAALYLQMVIKTGRR